MESEVKPFLLIRLAEYPALPRLCFMLKSLHFSFSLPPPWPQGLIYWYETMPVLVFGGWKIHVPSFGPELSENTWFCVNHAPSSLFSPGVSFQKWNNTSNCFQGNRKYMCQIWLRSIGKGIILPHCPFPSILAPVVVFRYETMPVFEGCKMHLPSLVYIR